MITDDERRDVAENIRNAANRRKDELQDDPDYSPFAALYAIFCGVRGFPRYKDLLHLADLIDRSTCHLVEDEDGRTACSECGCTALCLLDATYCPGCGSIIERPR